MQEKTVNISIGKNVRTRRSLMGFSQAALAKALGVTFQQVQKYEKGLNAISPAKLVQLSKIFECSIEELFDGLTSSDHEAALPIPSRKAIHLVHNFERIRSEAVRKQICDLVRAVADGG